jgi:hypothetical protein
MTVYTLSFWRITAPGWCTSCNDLHSALTFATGERSARIWLLFPPPGEWGKEYRALGSWAFEIKMDQAVNLV